MPKSRAHLFCVSRPQAQPRARRPTHFPVVATRAHPPIGQPQAWHAHTHTAHDRATPPRQQAPPLHKRGTPTQGATPHSHHPTRATHHKTRHRPHHQRARGQLTTRGDHGDDTTIHRRPQHRPTRCSHRTHSRRPHMVLTTRSTSNMERHQHTARQTKPTHTPSNTTMMSTPQRGNHGR